MSRFASVPRRGLALCALALLVAASVLAWVLLSSSRDDAPVDAPAGAGRPLEVGFADYLYEGQESDRWLGKTESVNADTIRINMYWSLVAPEEPSEPRDPDDPAYDWGLYDAGIVNAVEHGFAVDLTVLAAPSWAEGPGRPDDLDEAPPGSWKPDAAAFGDFAHALAERYDGNTRAGDEILPRLHYFEAWNEPNLSTYITPQFEGSDNESAAIYVDLLNHFYDEIKAVIPEAEIISGGTAPYGEPPAPEATKTGPLQFARELLCLSPTLRRADCAGGQQPKFDIYAHHPINREDPPTAHADRPGDVEIADFGELTETLRQAEKLHTPATSGHHELWANEVWWQTDPPDRDEGVPLETQARWMEQALYLLWKQGASNVSFLQFRDAKYEPSEYTLDSYQTGVYTRGGQRKPSADAIAFPFVTDRKSKAGLLAWGKAPSSGELTIEAERADGGFRELRTLPVQAGEVFTARLNLRGEASLRARVGESTSIPWRQTG